MNTDEVEMLTQDNCGQCAEAKRVLQGYGLMVTEFSQLDMFGRNDRVDVMSALAANDCKFPVMCLKGSDLWTGSVQGILQEVRKHRERNACATEQAL